MLRLARVRERANERGFGCDSDPDIWLAGRAIYLTVELKFGRVQRHRPARDQREAGQLITAKGRKSRDRGRGGGGALEFPRESLAMCLSRRAWRSHIISQRPEARLYFPPPPSFLSLFVCCSASRRSLSFSLSFFSRSSPSRKALAARYICLLLVRARAPSFIYLAGQEAVNSAGSLAVTN